jgi:hypothetical protein
MQMIVEGVRELVLYATGDTEAQLERLLGMIPLLTGEATKILSTTRRLSAVLRRLLDPRASAEHQQLSQSLQAIMSLAARSRGTHPVSMEIDHGIQLDSPMTRDFREPPTEFTPVAIDETISLASEKDRKKAAAEYAELQRIDWKRMQKTIDQALRTAPRVSLASIARASKTNSPLSVSSSSSMNTMASPTFARSKATMTSHRIMKKCPASCGEDASATAPPSSLSSIAMNFENTTKPVSMASAPSSKPANFSKFGKASFQQ